MCCHLHYAGRAKGQAAAALTGAPATVEAAAAEDQLKVCCLAGCSCKILSCQACVYANAEQRLHCTLKQCTGPRDNPDQRSSRSILHGSTHMNQSFPLFWCCKLMEFLQTSPFYYERCRIDTGMHLKCKPAELSQADGAFCNHSPCLVDIVALTGMQLHCEPAELPQENQIDDFESELYQK